MQAFDRIGEQRIQEAVEAGVLDNLPGRGKPLRLDEDRMVPREFRAAHRILKNAGLIPPSLALRTELGELEQQLAARPDGKPRSEAQGRLALLRMRLEAERGSGPRPQSAGGRYEAALLGKLGRT